MRRGEGERGRGGAGDDLLLLDSGMHRSLLLPFDALLLLACALAAVGSDRTLGPLHSKLEQRTRAVATPRALQLGRGALPPRGAHDALDVIRRDEKGAKRFHPPEVALKLCRRIVPSLLLP